MARSCARPDRRPHPSAGLRSDGGRPFVPAIFGSDIGAYSLARSFRELFGVKACVFGKYPSGPCMGSTILNFTVDCNLETPEVLERYLFGLAASTGKMVLALGVGDGYVRLLSACKDRAPQNVVIPYLDNDELDRYIVKERFYELCDEHGIAHPKTFVYRLGRDTPGDVPIAYPLVVKPSDSADYFAHPFPGQRKVYFFDGPHQFAATVEAIRASGYGGNLVVQEYIRGDDDCMYNLTCYSDASGKVRAACLGHVLLEEHTPLGIGNPALIVTGENDRLVRTATDLLESVGFRGFANFDIRRNRETGDYCFLELNARQGRSNYFAVVGGVPLVKHLVEDVINHRPLPYAQCIPGCVWTVVPRGVARRYANLPASCDGAPRWVNPLFYARDLGPLRLARLLRGQVRQFGNFRRYYHPTGGVGRRWLDPERALES